MGEEWRMRHRGDKAGPRVRAAGLGEAGPGAGSGHGRHRGAASLGSSSACFSPCTFLSFFRSSNSSAPSFAWPSCILPRDARLGVARPRPAGCLRFALCRCLDSAPSSFPEVRGASSSRPAQRPAGNNHAHLWAIVLLGGLAGSLGTAALAC